MRTTNTRPRGPRRLLLILTVAIAAALTAAIVPAASATTVPTTTAAARISPVRTATVVMVQASRGVSCPTVYWGSLAKSRAGSSTRSITGVRTGQHPCFDRLVVDLAGDGSGTAGYQVRYVPTVRQEGSGRAVSLRGGAAIEVIVRAPAYDSNTGTPTLNLAHRTDLADVTGYATLRQIAFAGSFEGQTTIALGVRARLPMRAFVLDGPGAGQRLVIDVYHHW